MGAINIDDVKVRNMNILDIDDVMNVETQCFTIGWSKESFEYEMKENNKALYVIAEYQGTLLGYAGLWKILDEGHITNIAVLKDFRKNGIATLMLNTLLDLAQKDSVNSFTLEVKKTNNVAISLYQNLGFEACGVRKGYYKDTNDDAIIMWKR